MPGDGGGIEALKPSLAARVGPAKLPLGLRVAVLVMIFNGVVFGGLLAWFTRSMSGEQAQLAELDEQLVLERLRNLLDERGQALTGEILSWSRWSRYEDAQIVQLHSIEPSGGLLRDLRRVALSGRTEVIPDGTLCPLRTPRPGPRRLTIPVPNEWNPREHILAHGYPLPLRCAMPFILGAMRMEVFLPRMEAGPIWGAALFTGQSSWPNHPARTFFAGGPGQLALQWACWPLQVQRALRDAIFLGLSPSYQRHYDASMSVYLREALISSQRAGIPLRFRGGVLLPLSEPGGTVWGAGLFPFRTWIYLLPTPLFAPGRWMSGAIIEALEEDPLPADLRLGGVYLNPMGAAHRPPTWDQDAVLTQIRKAAHEGQTVESELGVTVPLRLASGQLWGGVWLKPRVQSLVGPILRQIGPWFVLSTLVLTLATFFGVHRLVLDPVRRLARGARRLRAGDLGARVPEVARRDELADLVRSFNGMASEVQGFNARLEREVQQATDEAREAEAAAMTQRRLAATGELAAGIAHEINNPLGGMLNALEALGSQDLSDERRARYLELLQGGLERIGETVGNVLRLAPRNTQVGPLSLAEPLGDALGLIAHRAQGHRVGIQLEGAGGQRAWTGAESLDAWHALPRVRGQRNELGQAILNLLVNALDALEESKGVTGRLRIGLGQDETQLHLWVADNGPGMDAGLVHRAADLFFTTKAEGRGTGLGLAIVHNVVHGHGGHMQLLSPEGGGFEAHVYLPIESHDPVVGPTGVCSP